MDLEAELDSENENSLGTDDDPEMLDRTLLLEEEKIQNCLIQFFDKIEKNSNNDNDATKEYGFKAAGVRPKTAAVKQTTFQLNVSKKNNRQISR